MNNPDNTLFPLGQDPACGPSDEPAAVVVKSKLPAKPSKALLLEQLAERGRTRFDSRQLVTLDLAVGGKSMPLVMPEDGIILATVDGKTEMVLVGLSEKEVGQRAEELNTARCATGFHLWN